MPMNPAGVSESTLPDVRRKDGAPVPKTESPSYGPPWTPPTAIRSREANDVPPLFPRLIRKADGTRKVTISEGRVTEIVPRRTDVNDDGVIEHPISNIWSGGLLAEHGPITTGEVIGVSYTVSNKGFVNSVPAIQVRPFAGRLSAHYIPPVGDDTAGAIGDCFFVLAQLTGSGDSERLVTWHGGSNVTHYHDLAVFKRVSGDFDIFKEFDQINGWYVPKGITGKIMATGLKTIDFTDTGDELRPYTIGVHINHQIWAFMSLLYGGEEVGTEPEHVIYIRDGLTVAVGTGLTPPAGIDNTCDPVILKSHRCYAGD